MSKHTAWAEKGKYTSKTKFYAEIIHLYTGVNIEKDWS